MRRVTSALALLATTSALVLVGASPAAAGHDCQPSDLACFVTDETTVPVGTPVVGPLGWNMYGVPVAQICAPTCEIAYVVVPGAMVSSTGTTVTEITLPKYGVRVDASGFPTVWLGVPGTTGVAPGPLGVTLELQVPYVPVVYGDIRCAVSIPIEVGPVTAQLRNCAVYVTVAL